jgi:hypothetical protein
MFTGPNIITDGLVTYFDVANIDSFRGEPTTNVVSNPIPTTSWSTANAQGSTITRTFLNEDGQPFMRFSNVTNGEDYPRVTDSVFSNTITGVFSTSLEVRGTPGSILRLRIYENGSTKITNTITLTSEWVRYKFENQTTSFILNQPYFNPATTGAIYDIRNVQIEQKPYTTPFVNGTRGTTVATGGGVADISNNNNHGELVSGPTFNSDNLGSLVFDGVDDSIIVNGNIASISPVSVHGWFNSNGGTSYIVNQFQSTGLSWGIRISPEDRLFLFNDTSNVTNLTHFPFTIENNKWYNFVGGHNTNGFFLYVNGQLIGENANLGGGPTSISGNLILGQRGNNSNFFNGNISQVKIYNRALTADEILQNFNATKSRFGLS